MYRKDMQALWKPLDSRLILNGIEMDAGGRRYPARAADVGLLASPADGVIRGAGDVEASPVVRSK